MNSNQHSILATAPCTDRVSIRIYATIHGWNVHTIHHTAGDSECWDGRTHNSEAAARAAANKLWAHIRKGEAVAA